jgi:hypothetical protein
MLQIHTGFHICILICVRLLKEGITINELFGSEHINDLRRQSVWSYLNQLFLCEIREGELLSKIHFLQNVFIACVLIYIPNIS